MRDKFDIKGRDVRQKKQKKHKKKADYGYSVTGENNLPHVQDCLETLMS